MNRSALKNYAPKARLDFIRAVTDRAGLFGLTSDRTEPIQETGDVVIIGGRAFPRVVAEQRKKLQERINQHGFDQVMEAMAYTWFNRFVALRYMELHGYLDHGYRVLSPSPSGRGDRGEGAAPEILEHAEHVTLPGLDAQQVINLKLDGSREAELYRLLLVSQCNALHEAMPFLFEKIADETELLLPDNLLHSDSVIRKLVNGIEEADWQQVEIIGWLYQFYISDKKDEVIGKVVKSEDIPAATQLFTPNWIVKYLVQNTLGRQWLATYPDSPLRQQMEYYIEPAEQADEVKVQLAAITPKSLDPEKLTLLDDACGSGHILVEAYDLFKAIYQERGYRSKDISRLILQKNLFGLEIDDRAAQLAAFALLMKARADDQRIFADHIQPNIVAIQESKGLENLLRPDPAAAAGAGELPFTDSDLFPGTQKQLTLNKPTKGSPLAAVEPCLRELIKLFEHGKTFGSLIRVPPDLAAQLPAARQHIEAMIATGQLWENRAATLLLPLVRQADLLTQTYDAVVTNPPYLGMRAMNSEVREFAQLEYPAFKLDTYAAFIARCLEFTKPTGFSGLVTMHSWMFLYRFEEMRKRILCKRTILTLAHLGARAFSTLSGEVVQACAFAISPSSNPLYVPVFIRCVDGDESEKMNCLAEKRNVFCRFNQNSFLAVEGGILAYWISERMMRLFHVFPHADVFAAPRHGMVTSDNDRFLRQWWEVAVSRIGLGFPSRQDAAQSGKKWFPYNKGGSFHKWYGNTDLVINWENDGEEVIGYAKQLYGSPSRKIQAQEYYFKSGITWSALSGGDVSMRANGPGFLFDSKGSSMFCEDEDTVYALMAVFNSVIANLLLDVLAPTLDFSAGAMANLPVPADFIRQQKARIAALSKACCSIAKSDWDNAETSIGFTGMPLLQTETRESKAEEAFARWGHLCEANTQDLRKLEAENNRLLIAAYGLDGEVSSEVPEKQMTLARADREQDTKHLISYAIGCMMGRYSLDKPGLVYAHSRNEGFDPNQYRIFPADADGIIPITELAWFPDDATERFVEFIAKAWPGEHLEGNLKFIAESLGPNRDEHPRDTIRRYLATGFYKDHLQTYKRRPIYWLISSGKQKAFQGLVYLHRYHEGTLARMRTEYVISLQGKLSQRIEQLAGDIAAATSTSHRRKLEKEKETLVKQHSELVAFDEKLRHYADQRIALDIDDGVKVNYGKFGDLLAEAKAVTGANDE